MLGLAQTFVAIWIAYLFWYVQAFGNFQLILYGSTLASVACVGIHAIKKEKININDYPAGIWTHLLLAAYLFFTSYVAAQNKFAAVSATITYAAYCVVSLVIAYISVEKKSIDWLINIIICITFLCCFWVSFRGIIKEGYGHILGKNNNPNSLGVVMVIGIFALAYKFGKHFLGAVLSLILSFWPLYTIIGCGSRKSLIAAGIIYGVWLLTIVLSAWKSGRTNRIIAILAIISLVPIIYYASNYFYSYYALTDMAERMSHFANENSNSYRIYLYQRAWELFLEHPVLGIGIDQFKFLSRTGGYAHSTYAESIADFGFVGSVIYFAPILIAVWTSLKNLILLKWSYQQSLVLGLICAELFLGVGQVFFFDAEHFVAWTIIYSFLKLKKENGKITSDLNERNRTSKYVKY